ncbi:MAG: glycosyltransferase family 4 protein [Winogradskyella sp.]|nr:MAG: glycosyltransferase family 4 protein [Winogradskyella sp.]
MPKKICLLTDSLGSGGAEKMVANLSKSLVGRGYETTIVCMIDDVIYDYGGTLYNFGKIKAKHNKIRAFSEFKRFFKIQNFDVILDHRVRMRWLKEFVFSKFVFNTSRVIYCVHHYDLSLYFPKVSIPFLSKKTLVKTREIVAVSQLAKDEILKQLNLESQVIYNYPEPKTSIKEVDLDFEYIIAVGRLEKIKQFNVLIDTYNASELLKADIKLLIFGEGNERVNLQSLIDDNHLNDNVILKGFDANVDVYVSQAKALVMSSQSEGFPMVLIEALQLKTPVISFDCKSGPSEIIKHKKNGLLVKDQDRGQLIIALNRLLNHEFYNEIKSNLDSLKLPFTEEKIIDQWIKLIENN